MVAITFNSNYDLCQFPKSIFEQSRTSSSIILIVNSTGGFKFQYVKGPRAGPGPLGPRAPGILPPLPPPLDGPAREGTQTNF
ncbi:unnamed protein product [Nesidiocoris tenuis]|uniref:Uncharacterized protein n=1 Tax=Nesidiocoris tenuis TaxID=355587 RepID=A0A6H5HCQ0_9HEMI|nr:unnamed protein product [Nesidiocoris tenuis]